MKKIFLSLLPKKSIDTINTVLVVDLENKIATDSVRYVSINIPVTRLLAYDATQHGKGFGFGDGKKDRYYVEGWTNKEQSLNWQFRTGAESDCKLLIKYVAPAETSGGTYSISLDNNYSQHSVITGEKNTSVVTDELGTVHLPAGIHDLKISPLSFGKTELMKLLEVQLIPVA